MSKAKIANEIKRRLPTLTLKELAQVGRLSPALFKAVEAELERRLDAGTITIDDLMAAVKQ